MERDDFQTLYDDYWTAHGEDRLRVETTRWKAENLLAQAPPHWPLDHVIEVGSGPGTLLHQLSQLHAFKTMVAVDLSPVALARAAKRLDATSFVLSDAEHLPFRTSAADVVLLCDLLEHLWTSEPALAEAWRVAPLVLLKVPIEDALLFKLMNRLRNVRYGTEHPSGHLHRWNVTDVLAQLTRLNANIITCQFVSIPYRYSIRKGPLKAIVFGVLATIERLLGTTWLSRALIGGSLYVAATSGCPKDTVHSYRKAPAGGTTKMSYEP